LVGGCRDRIGRGLGFVVACATAHGSMVRLVVESLTGSTGSMGKF
jgi:hypothetical protein